MRKAFSLIAFSLPNAHIYNDLGLKITFNTAGGVFDCKNELALFFFTERGKILAAFRHDGDLRKAIEMQAVV